VSAFVAAIEQVRQADRELNQADPTPFPLPIAGLEAVVAGSVLALDAGDWWVPGLRERVGAVLRETPIERIIDGLRGAKPYRVAPPTPSPALRALYAVGIALSNPDACTLVHLGIGSTADGAWFEALNTAALTQANVIFVVAVHPLEGDAPLPPQLAGNPSDIAKAIGLKVAQVDGNDIQAIHNSVSKARKAGGPHLIEARLNPAEDVLLRAKIQA
jgi:TPP-dependent pyruvate/acetoin dehydrogenase alpha subunit